MTGISTISVPSIWSKEVDSQVNIRLLAEKGEKEQDIKNLVVQGYTVFNTHATVVNGVMYVTYVLIKED